MSELSEAVAKMVTAGVITPTNEDEEHTRKLLRYPDMPAELKDEVRRPAPKSDDAKNEADQPDKSESDDEKPDAEDVGGDKKVEAAAVLSHAREINAALTENLYDTTGSTTRHAA